jgi:hypothetical protein
MVTKFTPIIHQKYLDEMMHVSFSLINVMGLNRLTPNLSMLQRYTLQESLSDI